MGGKRTFVPLPPVAIVTCAMMNEHETGFLTFLTERSARRLRALWEGGPKRREAARAYLNQVEFNSRYEHPLTGRASSFDAVEKELKRRGAPPLCYVISLDPELDGRELPLDEAILAASSVFEGTFLSCLPGKLGLFEGPGIKSSSLIFR